MKPLLVPLALALAGCSMVTGQTFYLEDLTQEQTEASYAAAELWAEQGIPVTITTDKSEATGIIRNKDKKLCERSSGWTHQTVFARPIINLCPRTSWQYYREIIAHEMGHAVSGRSDHADHGNIMLPSVNDMQGFYLAAGDVDYIVGEEE